LSTEKRAREKPLFGLSRLPRLRSFWFHCYFGSWNRNEEPPRFSRAEFPHIVLTKKQRCGSRFVGRSSHLEPCSISHVRLPQRIITESGNGTGITCAIGGITRSLLAGWLGDTAAHRRQSTVADQPELIDEAGWLSRV